MQFVGTFSDDTCHIYSVASRHFSDFSGERISFCKCDIIICACTKFSILNTHDRTESNALCRDSYGEVH
jgi:hypothetical protein